MLDSFLNASWDAECFLDASGIILYKLLGRCQVFNQQPLLVCRCWQYVRYSYVFVCFVNAAAVCLGSAAVSMLGRRGSKRARTLLQRLCKQQLSTCTLQGAAGSTHAQS
jgi:hypothetical protein